MRTNIKIDRPAPDFTLKNTEGDEISLTDFKGQIKIVLLFFPLAFTKVSAKALRTTRDNMKLYSALGATVIGISVDSIYTLRAFKKAENLNFTLLSDFNKEVSRRYGTLSDDYHGMEGVSEQAVFIIDKEGIIRYRQITKNAGESPDFKTVQKRLSDIN